MVSAGAQAVLAIPDMHGLVLSLHVERECNRTGDRLMPAVDRLHWCAAISRDRGDRSRRRNRLP
jgi:hypothetical protein